MNQTKTILQAIIAHILGRKYWANIVNLRGTARQELSSFIFSSKEEAERHKESLSSNLSYQWLETISFRSRYKYSDPS